MTRRKAPVLQVEQLYDDGSHPAIAEPLFSGEYGAPTGAPPAATIPACPGQEELL